MRRHTGWILGVVALAAGYLLMTYPPWEVAVRSGREQVTVTFATTGPFPDALSLEPVASKGYADQLAASCVVDNESRAVIAVPFFGQALTVDVRFSDRVNSFGWVYGFTQERYLVIITEWPAEGKKVGQVAALPDTRRSRHLHVTLP